MFCEKVESNNKPRVQEEERREKTANRTTRLLHSVTNFDVEPFSVGGDRVARIELDTNLTGFERSNSSSLVEDPEDISFNTENDPSSLRTEKTKQ